jgi:hypothetical protein
VTNRDLDIRGLKIKLDQLEQELDQSQRRITHLNDAKDQKDAELAQVHMATGQEVATLN